MNENNSNLKFLEPLDDGYISIYCMSNARS